MNKGEGRILKQFTLNFWSNLLAILETVEPFSLKKRLSGLSKLLWLLPGLWSVLPNFTWAFSLGLGEAAAFGSCRGGDAPATPEAVPQSLFSFQCGKRRGFSTLLLGAQVLLCCLCPQSLLPQGFYSGTCVFCWWYLRLPPAKMQSCRWLLQEKC